MSAGLATVTLRSWSRRYRRGRLEPLDATAARVCAQIHRIALNWPGVKVDPFQPVLVQDGVPTVYRVGEIDFWQMTQRTDLNESVPVSLHVLVHRRTLADPWECTCLLSARAAASLATEPIEFESTDSPAAQVYARFWQDLARRCELVLKGLD